MSFFDFWVHPLPPDGPVTFVASWPEYGAAETRADLDGSAIRAARRTRGDPAAGGAGVRGRRQPPGPAPRPRHVTIAGYRQRNVTASCHRPARLRS